jgi:hypothetical protein
MIDQKKNDMGASCATNGSVPSFRLRSERSFVKHRNTTKRRNMKGTQLQNKGSKNRRTKLRSAFDGH